MNRSPAWMIAFILVIQIASFSFEEAPTIIEFDEPSYEDTSSAYGRNNSSGCGYDDANTTIDYYNAPGHPWMNGPIVIHGDCLINNVTYTLEWAIYTDPVGLLALSGSTNITGGINTNATGGYQYNSGTFHNLSDGSYNLNCWLNRTLSNGTNSTIDTRTGPFLLDRVTDGSGLLHPWNGLVNSSVRHITYPSINTHNSYVNNSSLQILFASSAWHDYSNNDVVRGGFNLTNLDPSDNYSVSWVVNSSINSTSGGGQYGWRDIGYEFMDNGNNWPAWSPGAAGHGTRQGHGNLVDSGTINITGNGPYYTNSFTLNSSLGIYCVNFQLSNGTDTYRHITGTCFGTNAIVGNNSGGNNTGGGNNSTSDAHCLILNNATINQTNYVTVDLVNTCSTAIMYPGINASSDNSGVEGLYDIWWYVIGENNTTINMGWQLLINQSVQNGTLVTLYFAATVLNCGPNNSWAHDCPTSTLSNQLIVLNNNTGGNNTGGNNTGGNNTSGNNTGGNNTGGNNTGGNNTGGNNTGGNNTGGNNTGCPGLAPSGVDGVIDIVNVSTAYAQGDMVDAWVNLCWSPYLGNTSIWYTVWLNNSNGNTIQNWGLQGSTWFPTWEQGIDYGGGHWEFPLRHLPLSGAWNLSIDALTPGDTYCFEGNLKVFDTSIGVFIWVDDATPMCFSVPQNNNTGNNTGGNNTGGNNTGGNNTGGNNTGGNNTGGNNTGGNNTSNNTGGNNTGNNTGGNNTTANTAPQISSVVISPSSPLETDVLTCSYVFTDADNDPDESIFVWTVNGATVTSVNSVLTTGYVAGDFVTCAVLAYDGMDYGNMGTSTVLINSNATGSSNNSSGGGLPSIGIAGTLATIGLSFIAVTRRGRKD